MTDTRKRCQNRYLLSSWLTTLALCCALLPEHAIAQGHWVALTAKPPLPKDFKGIGLKLLLSDGTVMAQVCTSSVSCGNQWARLTPDSRGSYVNGSWTMLASMHFERADYASTVLPDGRIFVIGGEYTDNLGGGQADIYDPKTDTWKLASAIPKSLFNSQPGNAEIRDAESMTIPGGKVLLAPVMKTGSNSTIIYDPASDTWSTGASFQPGRSQDEASWVKLPDESILVPDNDNVHAERYLPASNQWVDDAPVPSTMQLYSAGEMGPGLLLPNGHAVFFGGTGHTALYTPPTAASSVGTWSAGPDIPSGRVTADAPAAMMANGKILVAVGSTSADGGSPSPTWFYEYNYATGSNGSFVPTSSPGNSSVGSQSNSPAGNYTFLALPDGTILVSQGADMAAQLYVYDPGAQALPAAKPVITAITGNSDGGYHLTGTGLNGISAGAAFGDDAQMGSNYPLVRLTDRKGIVTYARTYNWSSTGVMTGNAPVTTEFMLPTAVAQAIPGGTVYSLVVVANGGSSDPVDFTAPLHFTMEGWKGAWGSDGPIFTGDLNGDGKTDVFMWRASDKVWTVNLSP
jgi:hypothetical protein